MELYRICVLLAVFTAVASFPIDWNKLPKNYENLPTADLILIYKYLKRYDDRYQNLARPRFGRSVMVSNIDTKTFEWELHSFDIDIEAFVRLLDSFNRDVEAYEREMDSFGLGFGDFILGRTKEDIFESTAWPEYEARSKKGKKSK
ncbi:uncharacterized protein LOC129958902 [Argiope bruennichi]|uniref:uncharacterized protein LOC129958902 n=1 Tax=Argiope bruennichi TaxID=94029 RepID=UPI0024958EAF|nr:uncharacterized protein LOC129958902 [Argiope bruennichi]